MTTNRITEFCSKRAIHKGKKDISYYLCKEENERHSTFFRLIRGRGWFDWPDIPCYKGQNFGTNDREGEEK